MQEAYIKHFKIQRIDHHRQCTVKRHAQVKAIKYNNDHNHAVDLISVYPRII